MIDLFPAKRALISVSDKGGLIPFVTGLHNHGIALISTGGTARAISDAGLPVQEVSTLTGFPEMLDGRVKTLHPMVHGGLLGVRSDDTHAKAMAAHGMGGIDILVVNLYPFEQTVAAGAGYDDCIENIDIGGPAMIRSAAKNHRFVTVVTDVQDYDPLLTELATHQGQTTYAFRQSMARTAFGRTAAYDAAISTWMAGDLPRRRVWAGGDARPLRYGENPHQAAAFYSDGSNRPSAGAAQQHQGKALSYNNINDTDAAFELICEFPSAGPPACAIIKHANPCGVATGADLASAYRAALACDQTSAFGGIIALNQTLDAATAQEITKIFTEVVIAPDATVDAIAVFAQKPNLRLLTTGRLADPKAAAQTLRQVSGGYLVQDKDVTGFAEADIKIVTKRAPTRREMADMAFAWTVAKHTKSNAIIYAKDGATVGIGAGQMSRVDSTRIAARKAQDMQAALGLPNVPTKGSVVASDAFFPFADGLLTAAKAGATALIQPGGSMRDGEVIAAADAAGLAMVFTGQRHFRH